MNSSTHKFWASSFVVQIVQFNLWHTHYKLQMRQSQWWCRSVRFDADYFTYYLSIITTRTRQMRVETVITLSKIGILDTFSGRSLWKRWKSTHISTTGLYQISGLAHCGNFLETYRALYWDFALILLLWLSSDASLHKAIWIFPTEAFGIHF